MPEKGYASLDEAALAADEEIKRLAVEGTEQRQLDIVRWAHNNFYIPGTGAPIVLAPHQQAVLRFAFTRLTPDDIRIKLFPHLYSRIGHFPFTTIIISTVKKSGKSTLAAVAGRFIAETQSRFGEVYCIGNDLDQAKERSFKFIADSVRLTPGARQVRGEWILPGRYVVQRTRIESLESGTLIKAISVDAAGEAGGNPDLTIWTELWGFEYEDALRFWDEMTPVPTKIDSLRLVETYAGFDGESTLLQGLYEQGKAGRRLRVKDVAEVTDTEPDAFRETEGDPEAELPMWVNEAAGLFMYWDDGNVARRMPWQQGDRGEAYYREQEQTLPPPQFARLHRNEWTGAESDFVPMVLWDACQEDLPSFAPEISGRNGRDPQRVILGVDAATTGDCFGVVAVTRHPAEGRHDDVAVRAVRKWDPAESGGLISYEEADAFIRQICKLYKVVCLVYDPFQLAAPAQGWARDRVTWAEPFNQGEKRLEADRLLYDLIIGRHIAHDGNSQLREHMQNAKARLQKQEDSKLRIIKKSERRKIDLVVAMSMATYQCKYLIL